LPLHKSDLNWPTMFPYCIRYGTWTVLHIQSYTLILYGNMYCQKVSWHMEPLYV
jgi:hypothetical protein